MATRAKKINYKKGIYEDINKKKEYADYDNILSITSEGFIVVNEKTDFSSQIVDIALKTYKKIRYHPIKDGILLLEHIMEYGIPEYITHLVFDFGGWSKIYNTLMDMLPSGLEYLGIDIQNKGDIYNGEITNEDRDNKYHFNEPINNLPASLEELYITSLSFDQPLDNLPPNMKILVIKSDEFNQSIDNLPIGLEILIIDKNFMDNTNNIKLDNLPPKLKHLYVICDKIIYTKELLPATLERISLPDYQLG